MEKIRVLLVGSLVNYKAIIARKLALIGINPEFLEAPNTEKAQEILEEYRPELTLIDNEYHPAECPAICGTSGTEISFSLN